MLVNRYFDDCYFSVESGYYESKHVFVDGSGVLDSNERELYIGETGFGTGLNLLVLEDHVTSMKVVPQKIIFTSVEKYPLEPDIVERELRELDGVTTVSLKRHMEFYRIIFKNLSEGWNQVSIKREWGDLVMNLYIGDVMDSFISYPQKCSYWFLDGHSPDKNPEMWSEELFLFVAQNSMKKACFATFTAAGVVKRGLRSAGFFVKRAKGYGQKRHMIRGFLET